MKSIKIDKDYLERLKALGLPEKQEPNIYLVIHLTGDGIRASEKFNVKVYKGKRGLTLFTNDFETLKNILEGRQNKPKEIKRTIAIDDSGWGFALGGVLTGVYDSLTGNITTKEIKVEHFQGDNFDNKRYLVVYAETVLSIIKELSIDKETTLIKICTGYVNSKAKDLLREQGYCVEVAEIGEPLQSELEKRHKEYIKSLGYDAYYDPKELEKGEIASEFNKTIEWIKEHKLMHLAKSGWQYFNGGSNG